MMISVSRSGGRNGARSFFSNISLGHGLLALTASAALVAIQSTTILTTQPAILPRVQTSSPAVTLISNRDGSIAGIMTTTLGGVRPQSLGNPVAIAPTFAWPPAPVATPATAVNSVTSPIVVPTASVTSTKSAASAAPAAVAAKPAPIAPPAPKVINAPFYSQLDGTVWAPSNCGPTALSMGLAALGVSADQLTLRHLADLQMGVADPNGGTTWESLADAAHQNGVTTLGLYADRGNSYRAWTLDELKAQLSQGHPVLLLTRYWDMPDHLQSQFAGDHYILATGVDASGDLVFSDPALSSNGDHRVMTPTQLDKAWANPSSGLRYTAMALAR